MTRTLDAKHYLLSLSLNRDKAPSFADYPHCLPVIRNLTTIEFHPHVTFIVGENGTGKSTLLEAIAVASGFNPEGGSRNFNFSTRASHSPLTQYPDHFVMGEFRVTAQQCLNRPGLRQLIYHNGDGNPGSCHCGLTVATPWVDLDELIDCHNVPSKGFTGLNITYSALRFKPSQALRGAVDQSQRYQECGLLRFGRLRYQFFFRPLHDGRARHQWPG